MLKRGFVHFLIAIISFIVAYYILFYLNNGFIFWFIPILAIVGFITLFISIRRGYKYLKVNGKTISEPDRILVVFSMIFSGLISLVAILITIPIVFFIMITLLFGA